MRKLATLTLAVLVLTVGAVWAGQMAKVSCTNPGCGYAANLAIGGGMKSPSITGYCAGCRDFVQLKLATWRDYRGKTFNCPQGHGPFTPIYGVSDISRFPCPKCGQRTLQANPGIMFD